MAMRWEIASRLYQNSCTWFTGRACHPEPDEIERMIISARRVLLPNYFSGVRLDTVGSCIDALHTMMAEQIHRALFQRCLEGDATTESRALAETRADEVISRFPDIQAMLAEDVAETYHGDPAATGQDEILLTYPGPLALLIHRIARAMYDLGIPLLPRMVAESAHRQTGIEIHPGATLGRSIMIDHGTGIVVGETAIVGSHVKMYQGVTLGALYFPRDETGSMVRRTKRHPTVEDYAVLYANATVLGGDTVVGEHSVIGSNAWVTSSVPPHSRVLYQAETVVQSRGR